MSNDMDDGEGVMEEAKERKTPSAGWPAPSRVADAGVTESGQSPVVGPAPGSTIRERLYATELRMREIYGRLNEGARNFTIITERMERDQRANQERLQAMEERIEHSLAKITSKIEPKRLSGLGLAGIVLSALGMGGGVVFAAGGSPRRQEVDSISAQLTQMRVEVAAGRVETSAVAKQVDSLTSQVQDSRGDIQALMMRAVTPKVTP